MPVPQEPGALFLQGGSDSQNTLWGELYESKHSAAFINVCPLAFVLSSRLQEAARAADRAILTFYGRNHPAAVTHFPKETYQV